MAAMFGDTGDTNASNGLSITGTKVTTSSAPAADQPKADPAAFDVSFDLPDEASPDILCHDSVFVGDM